MMEGHLNALNKDFDTKVFTERCPKWRHSNQPVMSVLRGTLRGLILEIVKHD
jgi:hypothetical protein